MTTYLYARVSTADQTVENQKLAAERSGHRIDEIFADEDVSGSTTSTERNGYGEMFAKLQEGDVVVVAEVSRIGRNAVDVLTQTGEFKKRGVKLCVLSFGNIDLTSDIGELIITMAAAFAQMELKDLKRRTKAGLERTKNEGTKLGRPPTITPKQYEDILQAKKDGKGMVATCKKYKISLATAYKNLDKWGENVEGYAEEYRIRKEQYKNAKK